MRCIFLFLFAIIISACGSNHFETDFDLSDKLTDTYNVTYYATDINGGKTVQAVASLRDGKCQLDGVTKRPTLLFITGRRSSLPLIVYADRNEKIRISGEGADPLNWNVEGNRINDALTAWRHQNIEALVSDNTDSVNAAVKKYVEGNPDKPEATLIVLGYYNREKDERGYASLMASLRGEAKKEGWLALSGRADQMFHSYSFPARLESLVLRSNKEGADTVAINGETPVFLLLWHNGNTERKQIADSLKTLEKEYKDSVTLIADLCLDADSVEWRRNIRKDSLEKTKRLWVPTGLTDPRIMKLKVPALPYYIVFNADGYQAYRGNDLAEAMKEFRCLQGL